MVEGDVKVKEVSQILWVDMKNFSLVVSAHIVSSESEARRKYTYS